jgi:hypothetical protein
MPRRLASSHKTWARRTLHLAGSFCRRIIPKSFAGKNKAAENGKNNLSLKNRETGLYTSFSRNGVSKIFNDSSYQYKRCGTGLFPQ